MVVPFMIRKNWKWIGLIVLLAAVVIFYFSSSETIKTHYAAPEEVVKLTFELDKKFEFGEYFFNLDNGKGSSFPLCFCLTEKNMFPPQCLGDVKYIYNNTPAGMCVPMSIGTGSCGVKVMSSSSFATVFMIPLEYKWTKPFETIVMGIRVPAQAPKGAKLVVEVSIFKRVNPVKVELYRTYKQQIIVGEKTLG